MYIFRRPSPAKFISFSGFWAYLMTDWILHPHIFATSLLMCILTIAIVAPIKRGGIFPPLGFGYFATRSTMRTASLSVIPIPKRTSPIVPKSIDFTSCMGYVVRAGVYAPAALINLTGQSEELRTLLWLPNPLRLTAPAAGFFCPSYSHPLYKAVSLLPYTINLSQVIYFVKRNLRKKVNFFRDYFSALSAFFLGRPLPGTLRIILKSSLVYKASCENGLRPARRSRFLTVAVGIFNNAAISLTVIPCIFLSIDKFIKKVNIKRHFTTEGEEKWESKESKGGCILKDSRRNQWRCRTKVRGLKSGEKHEKPVSQIAADLGINENMLRRWVQSAREAAGTSLNLPRTRAGAGRGAGPLAEGKQGAAERAGRKSAEILKKAAVAPTPLATSRRENPSDGVSVHAGEPRNIQH
jgi:transposase-like protein